MLEDGDLNTRKLGKKIDVLILEEPAAVKVKE